MAKFKKDPNAVLDYKFDWTDYLTPVSDVIANVTWVLDTGLTLVSSTNTAMTATIFVSGGAIGDELLLTCRIVTTGGRTDDRSITLLIVSR